ncbi:MAG: DNA-binding NarL/FixJ family response regulator, partial [Kiritimatiellia bacterium]
MTGWNNNALATVLFALVAILVGADLVADAGSGADVLHVAGEGAGALLAIVSAVLFYRYHVAERRSAAAWREKAEELLAGVGNAVEEQFQQWSLSPAESEVALLLLKGLSFKEIGAVRDTSERTGREQARAVYKKSGVSGRSELSAWFIEDLLPPH